MAMSIEQLIDIVNQDLTMTGLFPKILPDKEIKRLITEHALEWFYKNYQFSVIKSYYYMANSCFTSEAYTKYKYFILPDEVENITRIIRIDDPSLFRLGIQAPHLSINLGVTNQPFLTSFVTTVGELATYRSIISAFSDEINKLNKPTLKFAYNPVDHRLHMLTNVDMNLMLEVYLRIEQEDLFDLQLFKDYVIGLARVRQADAVGRFNFNMPGGFQYNAADMKSEGNALLEKTIEKIKGESQISFFFMSR